MLNKNELLLVAYIIFLWLISDTLGIFFIIGAILVLIGSFLRIRSATLEEYLAGNFILPFGYCFLKPPHLAFIFLVIIYFLVYRDREMFNILFSNENFFWDKKLVSILLLLLYFSLIFLKGKGFLKRLFVSYGII